MSNNMRTPEEKEKIVKEYLYGKIGNSKICEKYGIRKSLLWNWVNKYQDGGIDGLKSNTGKHKNPNAGLHLRKPINKIEKLELELMKKEIDNRWMEMIFVIIKRNNKIII